jgi:hypothetical protein
VLSKEEKRFIKYWEEQRIGGKYKYYLLYILAGSFIGIIVLFFLYSLFISPYVRVNFSFLFIIVFSVSLVTFITVYTWNGNEKKFRSIIKREIEEGQRQDDKFSDEKLI